MIPSGTKFVGINPDFPTAERKSAQNNAAQDVYTIEDIALQTSPTLQQVSDTGGLDNDSTIRQGTVRHFDNSAGGISLVCSNEKELQWEDGRQYYYPVGSPIVHCNSLNNDIPGNTFDETIGFAVGSRYTVLNTGKTYICTDATKEAAKWFPMGGEYIPTLDGENGAILGVSLGSAYYSINNGIVDVIIYGSVELDFSTNEEGRFSFTLPIPEISSVYGIISVEIPNQCNGIVRGGARLFSNDTTFVAGSTGFVAKFTYQAY